MRFNFLTGDVNWQDYGGKFISGPYNYGDGSFNHYYVLEVFPGSEAGMVEKYLVSLDVVAPSEVSEKEKVLALRSCGLEKTDINTEEMLVECLHSYGLKANVWGSCGNNLKKLQREAHQQADQSKAFLFGFHMDKPKNAFGNTGWDFLKGDIGFR